MEFTGFSDSLVRFLGQLKRNNNREWFSRNKDRYEAEVREPVLAFIRAIGPKLEAKLPYIFVSDSKVGGSMMRVYRDTRFGGDKTPYKTNVGIHFRHERGKDAHAPGCWMHVEPGEFWLAAGLWKPDADSLAKIRTRIAEQTGQWLAARNDRRFRRHWELVGDSLKRPPRGFDPGHPCVEDLKRKDHLGFRDLGIDELYRHDVVDRVAELFAASRPYMKFLCDALDLPF